MPRDYPVAGDPAMAQSGKSLRRQLVVQVFKDLRIRAQVGPGLAR